MYIHHMAISATPLIVWIIGFDIMKILSGIILTVGVVKTVVCCTATTPSSDGALHCSAMLHHCHIIKLFNSRKNMIL